MFTKRVGVMRKTNKKIAFFSLYLLASDPAFIRQPCPLNRLSKPVVFVFHLINVKVILVRCCFFSHSQPEVRSYWGEKLEVIETMYFDKTLV